MSHPAGVIDRIVARMEAKRSKANLDSPLATQVNGLIPWEPIEVRWLDSMSHLDSWTRAHDLAPDDSDMEHTTLGYVAAVTFRSLTVAQSRSLEPDNPELLGLLAIPRAAILSIGRR